MKSGDRGLAQRWRTSVIERYLKRHMLHGSRSSTYEVLKRYRCATTRSVCRSSMRHNAE